MWKTTPHPTTVKTQHKTTHCRCSKQATKNSILCTLPTYIYHSATYSEITVSGRTWR